MANLKPPPRINEPALLNLMRFYFLTGQPLKARHLLRVYTRHAEIGAYLAVIRNLDQPSAVHQLVNDALDDFEHMADERLTL